MTLILMNILAYLALLAAIGLVASAVWAVLIGRQVVAKAKSTAALFRPHRQSALQTLGIGKGIALKSRDRFVSVAGHAKQAALSVIAVKDEVVAVAKTVDVGAVATEAKGAVDELRTASAAALFLQQILRVVRQASDVDGA